MKRYRARQYKVKITSPASDDEYGISGETIAITVRDAIEYKKVGRFRRGKDGVPGKCGGGGYQGEPDGGRVRE